MGHQTSAMPDEMAAVFQELVRAYEAEDSIEARLAHDADKLETLLQARETARSSSRMRTGHGLDHAGPSRTPPAFAPRAPIVDVPVSVGPAGNHSRGARARGG
jgi:HD domain